MEGLGSIVEAVKSALTGGTAGAGADDAPEGEDYVSNPGELWKEVKELRDAARKARRLEEQRWVEAWAFFNGDHWGEWTADGTFNRSVEAVGDSRPHLVLNYVMKAVQTRLAHLTKNKPILVGVPATADEEARNATQIGIKVLDAYWRKLKMPAKLRDIVLWMLVTGKCFLKVYWDDTAGDDIQLPGDPVLDENGQPQLDEYTGDRVLGPNKVQKAGDLCVDICYPQEVLPDPGVIRMDAMQRFLHQSLRPMAEVKARFPQAAADLKPIDSNSVDGRKLLADLGAYGPQSTGGASAKLTDRVEVLEVWMKPCEAYPQGLFATFANDVFMHGEPTPKGYPAIPFISFDEIMTNTFWSTSTARQLVDLNKTINLEYSQEEYVRQVHQPKVLIPSESNIDPDSWDNDAAEKVSYRSGHEPKYMRSESTPPSVVELRKSLVAAMNELGGNLDVLSGKNAGEVRSGRQTNYLQEYAGTVLGVVAAQIESAFEELGNMALPILQAHISLERSLPLVGANREIELVNFKGATLKGMSAVVVQPGSALPQSLAARRDQIEHWMEMKWMSPEEGRRTLGSVDPDSDMYAADRLDRDNADEIIYRLKRLTEQQVMAATGGAIPADLQAQVILLKRLGIVAYRWDNQAIHLDRLVNGLMKTTAFRKMTPILQACVEALYDWREQLAAGLDPMHPSLVPPAPPGSPEPTGARPGIPSDGSPQALHPGQTPPGGGGVGGTTARIGAENGAETRAGLPSVPVPPGPGPGR